ncbi:MAG: hypothetical protein ACK5JS_07795 [Mangrovibacterium sp.]
MNRIKYLLIVCFGLFTACHTTTTIQVEKTDQASNRLTYGLQNLEEHLTPLGFSFTTSNADYTLVVGELTDAEFVQRLANDGITVDLQKKESFKIWREGKYIYSVGADKSGALYGLLELKELISNQGEIPAQLNCTDAPEMVLRGTAVGLQKTNILPGRHVYEYPIDEKNFPWFYDKQLWLDYLDRMVENRYNSLYLWSGHPFASLVKLKDYPYAVEVDDATFEKNKEIYAFLTEEADKRGIWVIQMFYNIILPKPFADHHGLKTQERGRVITPLIADYTRKSIAAFVENYPNVGLLVTLGEAMNTIDDDVNWFTNTIIPGVQDGLKKIGATEEPPIVLRAHDTDAERVMDAALPKYHNLYTMFKYNGESLTTYEPRDSWSSIPTALSKLGSVHISNVHIMANLEPFRYGSPDFIQKSTIAMHNLQGANGLHLYPQASYWDWPYTADKTDKRLLQIDRDWIWYDAWARYAWNCHRDRADEVKYWSNKLNQFYGSEKAGADILTAYEETGEIAPKLLRTFGISDGNRQSCLLGMTMGQLVNPKKYSVYESFWESSGPVKEVLGLYAQKEWNGEPHVGETPPQIIKEVREHAARAEAAIERASQNIGANQEEFNRLKNDVYCYGLIAENYAEKVKAAMLILRYKYSENIDDLDAAIPHLEKSLRAFRKLVARTDTSYLYANSMQTDMRRIPIEGKGGINKTWAELLPHYEAEVQNFKNNITNLKSGESNLAFEAPQLKPVNVKVLNKGVQRYAVKKGAQVYADNSARIKASTDELALLKGVRFYDKAQQTDGTVLRFKSDEKVKVVVGYFNTNSYTVLRPPTLETNAGANSRGQADVRIANAIDIPGLYPVNVYTYTFGAGEHELKLGKGRVLILGFAQAGKPIVTHDAGIVENPDGPVVDWLFY